MIRVWHGWVLVAYATVLTWELRAVALRAAVAFREGGPALCEETLVDVVRGELRALLCMEDVEQLYGEIPAAETRVLVALSEGYSRLGAVRSALGRLVDSRRAYVR